MGSLETAVQFGWRKLDPTLRWLALQATGMRIGCSSYVDYGYFEGMHQGIDPAKVRAVGGWRTSDLFNERERACSSTPKRQPPARPRSPTSWPTASGRTSDAEFVELAAWGALENFRSRFDAGLGLRSQGFSDHCGIPVQALGTDAIPLPVA